MSTNNHNILLKLNLIPVTTKIAVIILGIVAFIVFSNCLTNPFVIDDLVYIINNPQEHILQIFSFLGESKFNTGVHYRPLPALYFSIIYALSSTSPFLYHLLQIILHLSNAVLLYLLFKNFLNGNISLFLSVVFLVHPLQVESVSYISSSGNPLFFLFGLSALLLSIKTKLSKSRSIMIAILLILSLFSKETGILFIIIVLLYNLLFKKYQNRQLLISVISVVLTYVIIRIAATGIPVAQPALAAIANSSASERLITMPAILFYYISNFFYPSSLAIEQDWVVKTIDLQHFYLPLIFISLYFLFFCLYQVYLFRIKSEFSRISFFFLCWLILGLGAYSQFIPLDYTVADRWFYFPIVGVLGLIGVVLASIKVHSKLLQNIGWAFACVVLLILSFKTIIRNTHWSNPMTLYMHDREIYDGQGIERKIGNEYFQLNEFEKALPYYLKAQMLQNDIMNTSNIAVTYENMGNSTEAKKYYREVINQKYYPETIEIHRQAYERLAGILSDTENPNVTVDFINNALQLYPQSGSLWYTLAYSEYKLHKNNEALSAIKKAQYYLPIPQVNNLYRQILQGSWTIQTKN